LKRQTVNREPVFSDSEFAKRYADKHSKMARKFAREYYRKLKGLDFAGGRILDAGCGSGETLICLLKNFPMAEGIGIDLSEPLLEMAESNAARTGLEKRMIFKKANVLEIPFPANYYQVVLNINMAHLVSDPVRMFNEIERVLKAEGHLFIADIRRSWIGYLEKEFVSAFNTAEVKKLIDSSDIREGVMTTDFLWWYYETRRRNTNHGK
jgi:ubiquinone/menaquinone biosynthesis C-methylase UbiE